MKVAGILFFVFIMAVSMAQDTLTLDKLFLEGQFGKVVELGKVKLQKEPDNALLNSIIGRSLTEMGNFNDAIPYLLKAVSDNEIPDWAKAWSLSSLGICYYFNDEFLAAKDCFNICIEMQATQNVTRDATRKLRFLQLNDKFDTWEMVETDHFRFHIQAKDSIADLNRFIWGREKAYADINTFFNAQLPKKIDFYVWENTDEAQLFLKQELGFAIANLCLINVSKYQTRGHEIAHVLLGWGLKPDSTCAFINEGAATFFDHTNRNRLEIAKNEKLSEDFNVINLWENPQSYPFGLNYTVGAAWIEYLVRKGTAEQLKQFLSRQTPTNARKVYENFDAMVSEFNSFMQSEKQ